MKKVFFYLFVAQCLLSSFLTPVFQGEAKEKEDGPKTREKNSQNWSFVTFPVQYRQFFLLNKKVRRDQEESLSRQNFEPSEKITLEERRNPPYRVVIKETFKINSPLQKNSQDDHVFQVPRNKLSALDVSSNLESLSLSSQISKVHKDNKIPIGAKSDLQMRQLVERKIQEKIKRGKRPLRSLSQDDLLQIRRQISKEGERDLHIFLEGSKL